MTSLQFIKPRHAPLRACRLVIHAVMSSTIVAVVLILGFSHQGASKTAALENSAVPYIPPENELYDFLSVYREGKGRCLVVLFCFSELNSKC